MRRDHFRTGLDAEGAGYFYSGLGSDLKNLFPRLLPLRDLQGVELVDHVTQAASLYVEETGKLPVLREGP